MVLAAKDEGSVRSMACITFTIRRFFCSFTFSSEAEGCPLFYKKFVRSDPSGLSSLKGGEPVITFRISATLAAEAIEGASSPFGSEEGTMLSFRYLEIAIFGSCVVLGFFKAFSSSFINRAAYLLRMLTILFLFIPSPPSSSLS
jgi:hypothetical protein